MCFCHPRHAAQMTTLSSRPGHRKSSLGTSHRAYLKNPSTYVPTVLYRALRFVPTCLRHELVTCNRSSRAEHFTRKKSKPHTHTHKHKQRKEEERGAGSRFQPSKPQSILRTYILVTGTASLLFLDSQVPTAVGCASGVSAPAV